jgi:hypothetical protein
MLKISVDISPSSTSWRLASYAALKISSKDAHISIMKLIPSP